MFGKRKNETDLRCPFDKQPCITTRCVGWQTGPAEKMIDGVKQTVLHSDCFVVWDLLYKKAIANRSDGTQVAVEGLRNEVAQGNAQIQNLRLAAQYFRVPSDQLILGRAKNTDEGHDHSPGAMPSIQGALKP